MQKRRDFLRQTAWAGAGIGALQPFVSFAEKQSFIHPSSLSSDILPNPAQQAWMDLKFGMFIHFGINTYYDVEWSDGTLDPSKVNPTDLDTDEWCSTAKKAGMKYVVLIAKHHDGYCNWPSQYTSYSVKASANKIDLVKRVAESARKFGLAFGLYYSLWDRHEKTHDTNEAAYVEFMKNQIKELLTNYGPVCLLWFDGFWKKQQSGWKKQKSDKSEVAANQDNKDKSEFANPDDFIASWRHEGAYRWQMDHLYQFIKSIQPDCLVGNNATTAFPGVPLHPVDFRCGEKATNLKGDKKIWNWLGKDVYIPLQIETTMSQKGAKGNFETGSWFWHEWDHSVASKQQVKQWLQQAAELKANFLLNCGPMANGRLRPEDKSVLESLNL